MDPVEAPFSTLAGVLAECFLGGRIHVAPRSPGDLGSVRNKEEQRAAPTWPYAERLPPPKQQVIHHVQRLLRGSHVGAFTQDALAPLFVEVIDHALIAQSSVGSTDFLQVRGDDLNDNRAIWVVVRFWKAIIFPAQTNDHCTLADSDVVNLCV